CLKRAPEKTRRASRHSALFCGACTRALFPQSEPYGNAHRERLRLDLRRHRGQLEPLDQLDGARVQDLIPAAGGHRDITEAAVSRNVTQPQRGAFTATLQ